MNEPENRQSFWSELYRRRVFRSAAAYIVFAWVVIQVASIIFPEFGAPDWAMRALVIFFIVGFPPAILLAWTVDISAKGISRTPESMYSRARGTWPQLITIFVAILISAGMLWWAWDDYIVQSGGRMTRAPIKSQAVVAVHPPQRRTGDSEFDWLGEGVANLARSELAESRHANVVSQSQWQALVAAAGEEQDISVIAREAGIDYLIHGDLFELPSGITLTLIVDDVETGMTLDSPRITAADSAEIIARVPQVMIDIKSVLNIPHTENVGVYEADFASTYIGAYESYIAGLAYLIDFNYEAAEQAFASALEDAPDYHAARYRLAQVYEYSGRPKLAREALDQIPDDAPFSERLRLYVDGANASFFEQRDMPGAIEIYRQLVERYPYESEAGHYLAEAYWLDYQNDASIAEFRRIAEIHPFDPVSWMSLGERLLDVGELDEAQVALERYASMRPDDDFAYALLGNLAILKGDLETAVAQHRRSLDLNPGFVVASIGIARAYYLQGDVGTAIGYWQDVVTDDDNPPSYRIDAAFDLGGVLRGTGRMTESIELFDDLDAMLEDEGVRFAMSLSERGTAELALGRIERADAVIARAVDSAPGAGARYLFARGMLEVELGRRELLEDTITTLRSSGDAGADGNWKEENAADYLAGLMALADGELDAALALLGQAAARAGYRYAVYELGLALACRAAGDLDRAAQLASQAAEDRDPGDLRLDLELDRAQAQLLHAEILAELGDERGADESARRFLARWQYADAELPEVGRATGLLLGNPAGP